MWLLVDVAGILSVTGLHSEEDAGHTHLEKGGGGGGEGQGLSCVDTSQFMLLPGVYVRVGGCFSQLRSAGGRPEHRGQCLIITA